MQIKELLIAHEGIRLKPYKCTAGKLTIGIGRNLDDVGISADEANILFENDLTKCKKQLSSSLPFFNSLDEVRQAVLIDMCFNMGLAGLLAFKNTLALIKDGNYTQAANEMLDSKWAAQVKGRATQLSEMMSTGDWPCGMK